MAYAIQIGSEYHTVESALLPPVGTLVQVDRALNDGVPVTVKVVAHAWRVDQRTDVAESARVEMEIRVQTQVVG